MKTAPASVSPISAPSRIQAHAFRLKPGEDVLEQIMAFAKDKKLKAAAIVSAVGSLTKFNLRYANQPKGTSQEGHFEIVSLVGTFNAESAHLHASVSTSNGTTLGGHLLPGNLVYTTLEIVVAELEDLAFTREHDPASGWDELKVNPVPPTGKKKND